MTAQMDLILDRLPSKRKTNGGWQARCPSHDDRRASLSISEKDGRILLHCHAGCEAAAVVGALGLDMTDLFPPRDTAAGRTEKKPDRGPIVSTYDYRDVDGKLLFQSVRYRSKEFSLRRPDGNGGWLWNLSDVTPVPYRLPELIDAVASGKPIFVPEGEKDADNLRQLGFVATTNHGGAGKWRASFSEYLAGASVVVLPDNDVPGTKHAEAVAASLTGVAAKIKVVELPDLPPKGDISDWIAAGGTPAQLKRIVHATPLWQPPNPEPVDVAIASDTDEAITFSTILPLTDMGNAQRLVLAHNDDMRFDCDARRWLIWDGSRWKYDTAGQVNKWAAKVARDMRKQAAAMPSGSEGKALFVHADRSEAKPRLDAMVRAAAENVEGVAVHSADLDQDPMLLNVKNGIVDLRNGSLRPHARSDLITKVIACEYDTSATCPRWEEFLREVFAGDEELIAYIKRAIGYTITGDTSEQCFFLLHGDGSNGKTTMITVLREVMADYHKTTSADSLMAKRNASVRDYEAVGRLRGARFVSAIETNPSQHLAEGLLKTLTGQDPVLGTHLYGSTFEFVPAFKLLLACNHKPVVTGEDIGIWRRIKLVPFTVQFTDRNAEAGPHKDPALPVKLRMEYAGILRWMVEGALEWQAQGLGTCAAVDTATLNYRSQMDVLADFIESCVIAPDAQAASSALYQSYAVWCKENGVHALSSKTFAERLERRGFRKQRMRTARVWFGIGLPAENGATVTPVTPVTAFSETAPCEDSLLKVTEKRVTPVTPVTAERKIDASDPDDASVIESDADFDSLADQAPPPENENSETAPDPGTPDILQWAEKHGWPRLNYRPGATIGAGEENWRVFCRRPYQSDRQAALAAIEGMEAA